MTAPEQLLQTEDAVCLPFAPAICVEVKSPANSWRELEDKRALYFEAGCEDVWFCDHDGCLRFFSRAESGDGVVELDRS